MGIIDKRNFNIPARTIVRNEIFGNGGDFRGGRFGVNMQTAAACPKGQTNLINGCLIGFLGIETLAYLVAYARE